MLMGIHSGEPAAYLKAFEDILASAPMKVVFSNGHFADGKSQRARLVFFTSLFHNFFRRGLADDSGDV